MHDPGLTALLLMLAMGFFGSLHCIGMCGGLVAALSLSRPSIFWRGLVAYQAGRVMTYVILGLLVGLAGMGLVDISGVWLQRGLAIFAGLAMILFALNLGGWLPDPLARITATVSQRIGLMRLVQAAAQKTRSQNWMLLGMANGLLPCGLVYAALAMAMASASIVEASVMMASFGLGTVPAMLLAPLVLTGLHPNFRIRLLRFAALLLIALGLLTMARGLTIHASQHHAHAPIPATRSLSDLGQL